MGRVIHLGQVLEIKVGVNLSGGEVGVSQQVLYGAQVVTGFQDVGGKGVAHEVGIDTLIYAFGSGPFLYALLDAGGTDALTSLTDKYGLFGLIGKLVADL